MLKYLGANTTLMPSDAVRLLEVCIVSLRISINNSNFVNWRYCLCLFDLESCGVELFYTIELLTLAMSDKIYDMFLPLFTFYSRIHLHLTL